MGNEGRCHSTRVSAGTRVYYFDVQVDGKGQKYLCISEIPTGSAPGKKKRQRIFIHKEKLAEFAKAFQEAAARINGDAEQTE